MPVGIARGTVESSTLTSLQADMPGFACRISASRWPDLTVTALSEVSVMSTSKPGAAVTVGRGIIGAAQPRQPRETQAGRRAIAIATTRIRLITLEQRPEPRTGNSR